MGAAVALEWGVHHPEMVGQLVLLAPSAKSDRGLQLTVDLINSTIALDPEWQGGRYERNPIEGLRHAGMLVYPWLVSEPYLNRLSAKELAAQLESTARAFAAWDANALVLRYAAYRGHDVASPFAGDMKAALSHVTAPTLLVASASDRLVGTDDARRMQDGISRAVYAEIDTDLGHRALRAPPGTPEGEFVARQIRSFLAAPGEAGRRAQ
jgi:homoserine O-acetyltransferase